MEFKGLTSASHMSLQEAGYGSEEGQLGSEISGAVSGVTTPGASRLQASQSQERSTTMQRLQQCEWSDVRAIAPAPHLKEATQAFLLRFQKQLVGKGPKWEKGGRAASDVSGDPSLQSKGRTEQQARGSRRPRPTTGPREAAQAAGDGGGAREKAEILRLEAENKLLREQLKAAEAARKIAQDALTGERALWERGEKGWEKQRGGLQQQVTATAQVRAVGGGQRVVPTRTMGSMCCTCRRRRWSCTLHSAPNAMWPSTWGSKRPPSRS